MTKTYNLTESEFDILIAHYIHSLLVARDVRCSGNMSVNDFRNQNETDISEASRECWNKFEHSPTYEQIGLAISIYFKSRKK